MNPVLGRELRQRFRRRRAALFFTLWLMIVATFSFLIYLAGRSFARNSGQFGFGSFVSSAALGRMMFELIALFMMTAILFVVPGVMSLSIVGERERLTLKLLQMSQMRPREIILGKLTSGLSYVVLLLVAAGPVLVLPVAVGGVGVGDAVAALGMLLLTAVTLGSMSLWVSARAKTSRGAVAGSYLWAFVLSGVTLIVLVAEVLLIRPGGTMGGGDEGREFYSVWPNPYVGLVSVVAEPISERGGAIFDTPFSAADQLFAERQGNRFDEFRQFDRFDDGVFVGEEVGLGAADDGGDQPEPLRGPIWMRTVVIDVVIIGAMVWFSSRAVAAPAPPSLIRRRRRERPPPAPAVAAASQDTGPDADGGLPLGGS